MNSVDVATPTLDADRDPVGSQRGLATSDTTPDGTWGVLSLPAGGGGRLGEVARSLSKAGKLPGYRAGSGSTGDLFSFHGFGEPWDYEVRAVAASDKRVEFRPQIIRKAPLIFAIICILSIWPGAWLTDSMLKAYFSGYSWNTYLWYLPLTILPIPPLAWRMWTRSKAAAREHAQDKIAMLRDAIG
jgi:hypothetical protein